MIEDLIYEEDDEIQSVPTFDGDLEAFTKTLEELAINYIEVFFKDRKFHCGGPIPKNRLFSQNSINMVLSTSFADGVDEVYQVMPKMRQPKEYKEKLPLDVYRFLKTLSMVTSCGIPKIFQAGMMLLYYKYCHGCIIADKKLNITHIIE